MDNQKLEGLAQAGAHANLVVPPKQGFTKSAL
jgi:hypothetical protein